MYSFYHHPWRSPFCTTQALSLLSLSPSLSPSPYLSISPSLSPSLSLSLVLSLSLSISLSLSHSLSLSLSLCCSDHGGHTVYVGAIKLRTGCGTYTSSLLHSSHAVAHPVVCLTRLAGRVLFRRYDARWNKRTGERCNVKSSRWSYPT